MVVCDCYSYSGLYVWFESQIYAIGWVIYMEDFVMTREFHMTSNGE